MSTPIRAIKQDDGTYRIFIGHNYVDDAVSASEARRKVNEFERRGYNYSGHDHANGRAARRRRERMMFCDHKFVDSACVKCGYVPK